MPILNCSRGKPGAAMNLSNDCPCRLARLTFTALMAWAWAGGASQAHAADGTTARNPAERATAAEQLQRGLKAIEDADRAAPRDSFDPAYVARQFSGDRDKLFVWVRDQTL